MTRESGYGMLKSGRIADYLGPMVCENESDAREIVTSLVESTSRRIFWDIPGPNQIAIELASSLGFTTVRPLLRMWTGEQLVSGIPEQQYALADPATG